MKLFSRVVSCVLLGAGLWLAHADVSARAPVATATPATAPVPMLWKVSGPGDSRVYLLGSFHLLKPSDYPVAKEVTAAFEASNRVMFELSPEDVESPTLAMQMMRAAIRDDGKLLKDDLDPATWQKLQAYAAANQLPLDGLSAMKPWFVGLTITLSQMQRQGLDPALGLDRHVMELAKAKGKPATGLEDIPTQIALLAEMEVLEQRQMLAEALDQAEQGDAQAARLHDAWRRGDDALLWGEMGQEMRRTYPQLYRRINTDRNDAWLPKLKQQLQAGSGSTLVVVGALHLLGEDGVVEKLRAAGYKVERVGKGRK